MGEIHVRGDQLIAWRLQTIFQMLASFGPGGFLSQIHQQATLRKPSGFIATSEYAEPVRSLAKLFSNDKSLRFPLRVVKIFFRIVNFL